jgi:hypothetical protein
MSKVMDITMGGNRSMGSTLAPIEITKRSHTIMSRMRESRTIGFHAIETIVSGEA